MLASHAFRPITFVCNKNAIVNSAFVSPLYKGIVGVIHGVFQVAVSYVFTAFFQCLFHSRSAHFAINVIDFHLCWWPPISCQRGGILSVWRWVSSWCSRNPHISFSLSIAHSKRASWLVCLCAVPLWGALAPCMHFSVWRMFSSTGWPCTVTALCIATVSMYRSSGGTAASHSNAVLGNN